MHRYDDITFNYQMSKLVAGRIDLFFNARLDRKDRHIFNHFLQNQKKIKTRFTNRMLDLLENKDMITI